LAKNNLSEFHSKSTTEKIGATKKENSNTKRKYGIPTTIKAIRRHCLECVCNSPKEVKLCHIHTCSLWAYRFGRNLREENLIVREYDQYEREIKRSKYPGYCKT